MSGEWKAQSDHHVFNEINGNRFNYILCKFICVLKNVFTLTRAENLSLREPVMRQNFFLYESAKVQMNVIAAKDRNCVGAR